MRLAVFAVALVAVAPLVSAQESHDITFALPLHAQETNWTGADVALIHGTDAVSVHLSGASVDAFVVSQRSVRAHFPGWTGVEVPVGEPVEERGLSLRDAVAMLEPTGSWGLLISGGTIEATAANSQLIDVRPSGRADYPATLAPFPQIPQHSDRIAAGALATSTGAIQLNASGDITVWLYGLEGVLRGADGSMQVRSGSEAVAANGAQAKTIRYAKLVVHDTSLTIEAPRAMAAWASTDLQLQSFERVLLPLSGLASDVGQDKQGTWEVRGPGTMTGFKESSDGRVDATLAVADSAIKVDGQPLAALPATATVAATAFTLAALLKLIPSMAALLTKLPPEKALENVNRRKLYGYICKKPGATFREVLRGTGVPAGTARHHLSVLARSEMIVEHGHRSTLRFFENHGKFDRTWSAVVLLREPELARVHDWLMDNPGSIQKDLLAQADGWGWSRSTTQHRLSRLVEGGLVDVRQAGRRKYYDPRPPEQVKQPAPAWS